MSATDRDRSYDLLSNANQPLLTMRFASEPLDLPYSAFTLLRDLIHERTGAQYEDNKKDLLADKLSHRVVEKGLDSFLDYYYLLKYDAEAAQEWKYVMDALSVQETFFWREFDQVKALVDLMMPSYYANWQKSSRNFKTPLRIWSAACATGEEPISIAIALNEAGWFERLPIEIYASDASYSAIAKAQQGLYRERSFRNLAPSLQMKYFRPEQNGWRIVPEIHTRIKWKRANLLEESEVKSLAKVPIIFCRNVFIYFSEKAISKVVHWFYESMPNPGHLFVGTSESLLKVTKDFELQEIGGAFVYVKKGYE